MYIDLLKILRCPDCKGELRLKEVSARDGEEIVDAVIDCECGHEFKVMDGVIYFGSQEQELFNSWSSSYKEMEYEELDREIESKTPEKLKELFNTAKEYVVNELNIQKPNIILDAASGRGMLATYIAEKIDYSPMFILTDLSFEVLKYDRLKLKKINPNIKANFIACDCTNMPLKDNSVDRITSLFGITNMGDVTGEGIKDGYRILRADGKLLNTVFYIDCNTKAAKEIETAFREQLHMNLFNEILSKDGLDKLHRDGGFSKLESATIGEGVGEKSEIDAIPIEGEWFAIAVISGFK